MEQERTPQQVLNCEVLGFIRGSGRPRTTERWKGTVERDLQRLLRLGLTCMEEAEAVALDRQKLGWDVSVFKRGQIGKGSH